MSTGPQGFSGSQHKSQSEKALAQQRNGSQHKPQPEKPLTQQHRENGATKQKDSSQTGEEKSMIV